MNSEQTQSGSTVSNLRLIRKVGFWSAILTTVFYLIFDIAAILIMLNIITSKYWISISSYLPSLFLALTFVVLMTSLHHFMPQDKRFWTQLALAFAIVYATINCSIYVIQILVIAPSYLSGKFDAVSVFEMAPDKPLWAVNALAYTIMSISTFFASFAIKGRGINAWTRIMLRIHGIVAPTIVGVLIWPPLFYISATVGFTYPVAAILLAMLFSKKAIE